MKASLLGFALLVCAGVVTAADPVVAQERPAAVAELTVGWAGFPDDGITVSEGVIGGTARWYVRPRLSVGPELVYINGGDHGHLMLTGNLTWDLRAPATGRSRTITPFVTVGAGLFRTRGTLFTGTVTSHEGAFTAGGGVRAHVADRATVGAEARVGWELHLRITGFIGVCFGK